MVSNETLGASLAQNGTSPSVPQNSVPNEYAPGSTERAHLEAALKKIRSKLPVKVPLVIDGKESYGVNVATQVIPSEYRTVLCDYSQADKATVEKAIEGSLRAKQSWENVPQAKRSAIFQRAAKLVETKYRYEVVAATMLGQGKNAWQAEIDAAAESADFFRFIPHFASELHRTQPAIQSTSGIDNTTDWRPLEGFCYAVSPFNFSCLGPANLAVTPAILGNVVLLKPSPSAILSSYILYEILIEAGLPPGVIQFIPGDATEITDTCLGHSEFAGLAFIGSTDVFRMLWRKVGENIALYKSYPRLMGETGGKDYHLIHSSVKGDLLTHAVMSTIRAAFEYQGQKCSACSRVYVAERVWNGGFKELLVSETEKIVMGPVEEWPTWLGPVIHRTAFERCKIFVQHARTDPSCTILTGGQLDDTVGFYVEPTIILTTDPFYQGMTTEIFGPIVTIYVYADADFAQVLKLVDTTSQYALTGSFFVDPNEQEVIREADRALRYSAGNYYINDKSTGAVVGQQPFGGARGSGTNDKAATISALYRFASARVIKENRNLLKSVAYPSNEI